MLGTGGVFPVETVQDLLGGGDVDGDGDGLESLKARAGGGPGGEVAVVGGVTVVAAAELGVQFVEEGDSLGGEAAEHLVGDEHDPVARVHMGAVAWLVSASGGWCGGKGGRMGVAVYHRQAVLGEDGGEHLHLELDVPGGLLGARVVGAPEGDVRVLGTVGGSQAEAAEVESAAEATAGKGCPALGGGVMAAMVGGEGVLGHIPEGVNRKGAATRGDGVDVAEAGEGKPKPPLGGDQHCITGDAVGCDGGYGDPKMMGMWGGG